MMLRQIKQLSRFLSVGVANTILGLLIIYSAKWFLQFSDVAANMIGYSFGLVLSFSLNSRWTFSYRGPQLTAILKFLLVSFIAYLANLASVMGLIQNTSINPYLAQTLGVLPYTLISFVLSKYIVFANRN